MNPASGLRLKRALVTGANGFLGGHLVESLQGQNVETRAAIRHSAERSHLKSLDAECVELDWQDESALRRAMAGVDVVFHLAAAVASNSLPALYEANVGLTDRLARACAGLENPPVIIYCSSIAAGGPTRLGELRTEAQIPCPISEYGRSKRGGEIALARLADRIPASIVRPGIVVGPRNHELLPMFKTIALLRAHFVPCFHPPQLSLVYVKDVCEVLIQAAKRGARLPAEASSQQIGQGIYYASSWEMPNYGQLGRMIGEALGLGSPMIVHLTEPQSWLVGLIGEIAASIQGIAPAVSRDKIREGIATNWATSPAKTEQELGVTSSAPLAVRLEEAAQWYREAGWL